MVKPYVSSCDLKLHRELDERPLPSSSILSTNAPDSPYQRANHLVGPRALNAERPPSMHEKRANGAMHEKRANGVWRVCARASVVEHIGPAGRRSTVNGPARLGVSPSLAA